MCRFGQARISRFWAASLTTFLTNGRQFTEYVVNYTNAPAIINESFQDTEDLDGLFGGETWAHDATHSDPTLQHPRCVFQILKRHFSRYTPEMVQAICGIPEHLLTTVAEALCRNSGRERTSAFCYAVGWTQHSVGVQYIRTAAIIQLLLGNIGRPGGGIMALRGHASIQGSTDIPTLYNLLPGYLPMPKAKHDEDFESYVKANELPSGWWGEFRKYAVSLMKAYYGAAATQENGWCFDRMPLLTGDHSHMNTVAAMADGKVKGYFVMGENPTVGSMNGKLQAEGLRRLEWLVVRDLTMIETAEFWRDGVNPEEVGTEVFFFPAAAHTEKEGSFTNTQRLLQWHNRAIEPPGDCQSELDFMRQLGSRVKELYRGSALARDGGICDLAWDYPEENLAEAVLKEINGFTVADGKPVEGFTSLKDDGSTACGCWIYSGSYRDSVNMTARRKPGSEQNWVAPEWAWAWPHNRRMLYNRASADPEGKPWSERKRYVWWDEEQQKWIGHDTPDFIVERPPSYRPGPEARGKDTIGGADPFVMQADGKGWIFAVTGLHDGPLPTHYEPEESVVKNLLYGQQCNPARMEWRRNDNPYHRAYQDPRFPYLITTFRITEHHTAGGMSRWLAWLSELQPEMFCEVSPELAEAKALKNGGWATISTARAEIEARVLVTQRIRPVRIQGRTVHQIGLPYHWGSRGLVRGDSANDLIGFVADPNVSIQESKAFTANIEPGRRGKKPRAVAQIPELEWERDLPAVREKRDSAHGWKAEESKEGNA